VFGLGRALQEALPALETAVAVIVGVCAFVALLAAGVVAAWSIGFYFWLRESMTAPEAAFLAGGVLLVLCVVSVFAGRVAIRSSINRDATPEARRQDALASAIEAIGGMAESRPVPALLSALALGLAAGYLENGDRGQRPR
jgi:hypothetical protein